MTTPDSRQEPTQATEAPVLANLADLDLLGSARGSSGVSSWSTGVPGLLAPGLRVRAGLPARLKEHVVEDHVDGPVVLVLFVLFNTQTVEVDLVFAVIDAPLVLALVTAAVLGGLVVGLAELAFRARRKRR